MVNKLLIKKLVSDRDYASIIDLARSDAKRTYRYLMRLTYTTDDLLRHRAIEAIGLISAELADIEPDLVLDMIRRVIWAMCDESGAQSWSAPEIIAEIVYHKPSLYGHFAPIMINASLDELIFQKGMLWAVGRLQGKVSYTEQIVPQIIDLLSHSDPIIRGYAAWALGVIRASEAVDQLMTLADDPNPVSIYINGQMQVKTVGEWAQSSVELLT